MFNTYKLCNMLAELQVASIDATSHRDGATSHVKQSVRLCTQELEELPKVCSRSLICKQISWRVSAAYVMLATTRSLSALYIAPNLRNVIGRVRND